MKHALNTILLALAWFACRGQFYDAKWGIGDLPVTLLDFTSDSLTLDSINNPYSFFLTNANICDENGIFLYNTNGINIYDKNGDTLLNGTGINPCSYTTQYACCGLNILQAALFIPQPGNNRYYYLFHFSNDDDVNNGPETLYYSLIDKQGNGDLGAVLEKNVPLLRNTPLREGGMTACKHANGRDYWIIMGASVINTFYKFLVTPDSILGPYTQSIGPEFPLPFDNAYSRFSQDGSKYVTGVYEGPVLVMDFDRCSGEFSNPISIFNLACFPPATPCSGSSSVEISPNNRFIYVCDVVNLNQYDLWSPNIQDSVIQIFAVDSSQIAEMSMMQLAPNGKIYISTWGGQIGFDSIHVINNPNAKGDSCNFVYGGQPIFNDDGGNVPNLINYKLEALAGSGCDTITAVNNEPIVEKSDLHVYPNPTTDYAIVNYRFTNWNKGQPDLEICNALGQVVYEQVLPMYSGFQKVDVSGYASGVYMVYIKRNGGVVATNKLVKQ